MLDTNFVNGNGAGSNDLEMVTVLSDNVCKETWTLADNKKRCVAATINFKRKFITTDYTTIQNKCDVKLDYRRFEVFAWWKYDGQSTEPKSFNTNKGVIADFNRFLLPPEAAYGSAHGLQMTMSGLALAAWALLF